ncbi:cation:proton antiporter [Uliginosibacterium sp. H3]|uniref:Cation:proton antiporter n=1 Tax=Uliginosibacterium silvisoli TaxID=3114758 RepID=A0ABU6JZ03_9RHOO|nr:cation:proton antiporter [Uliginosibacterium sp. H3]
MSTVVQTAQSAVHQSESLLAGILIQLAIIVAAGRLGGELAARFGQARVVGEMLVGILLGPTLFGALAPELFRIVFTDVPSAPMMILSQIGLILLMFEIGMEFDFSLLAHNHHKRATTYVSILGIILPFALGLIFGYYAAPVLAPGINQVGCALFVATAFSITALPTLGRILMEFRLTRAPIGVVAISAAAINDVVGWLILMVVSALAISSFSFGSFSLRLVALAIYGVVCWYLVRPQLRRLIGLETRRSPGLSSNLLASTLVLLFVSALTTYLIGIFAIFGGFMLGLLVHDQREFTEQWADKVGRFVQVLLLPVFFTYTGLRTNVGSLTTAGDWLWCVALIGVATLGKFGGGYIAGRLAGTDHVSAKILGLLMNTRGLMELIVLNIGLDMGFISQKLFTMLVLMALVSNVMTTPGLKRWLPKLGDRYRTAEDKGATTHQPTG